MHTWSDAHPDAAQQCHCKPLADVHEITQITDLNAILRKLHRHHPRIGLLHYYELTAPRYNMHEESFCAFGHGDTPVRCCDCVHMARSDHAHPSSRFRCARSPCAAVVRRWCRGLLDLTVCAPCASTLPQCYTPQMWKVFFSEMYEQVRIHLTSNMNGVTRQARRRRAGRLSPRRAASVETSEEEARKSARME